jgi:hypothetical protein
LDAIVEIHDSTFQSNTATEAFVSNSDAVFRNFFEISPLQFPARHWNYLWLDDAPSIPLGLQRNLAQLASVRASFPFHCFVAPSEHFLRKELSQIFAPIPGGGHATFFNAPPLL